MGVHVREVEEPKPQPRSKREGPHEGDVPRWWKKTAGKRNERCDVAAAISARLTILDKAQLAAVAIMIRAARLYGNMAFLGLSPQVFLQAGGLNSSFFGRARLTYNLVQSCIDTATAQISANRPKPYFLTSGGDYKMQRKAKRLNDLTEGIFAENKMRDLAPMAFRSGGIFGDGIVRILDKHGRVAIEPIHPWELYVDEIEAVYGEPRAMDLVRHVDRDVLIDRYPESREVIEEAKAAKYDYAGQPNTADVVTVRESWHLPSSPKATDGKHIITIDGYSLTDMEDWNHPWFPFERFRWCPRPIGWRSQGLSEQLMPMQVEVNKVLYSIQRSHELGGTFKILLENGSKVVKSHLDNEIGTIINYTGIKPEYVLPPHVPPELYQHWQTIKASAYEVSGISQLAASAQKPAGLDSGKALREFYDIGSARMEWIGKEYERFHLGVASKGVAIARDIAEDNDGNYEVRCPGRKSLKSLNWKQIDLAEDEYAIQCFPISALPDDPAGRLQTVEEYAQAGYLDQDDAKRLLDFPDLQANESLTDAPREYINALLEKIVEDGEYSTPEPFDDLGYALRRALQFYANGKTQALEEEKLEMLRRFIGQCQMLLEQAQPPQPPAGAAQPIAPPEPAQPSPLVPHQAAAA